MRRPGRGFTLVELAVAIGVLALLIGGLLIPLATQLELSQQRDAQRQLETIREALIGFAIANGRLPCPANPTIPTNALNAGVERRAGTTCAAEVLIGTPWNGGTGAYVAAPPGPPATSGDPRRAIGVVPWVTLGLPELDPWGRRFTYVVEEVYANDGITNTAPVECTNVLVNPPTLCVDSNSPSANLWIATRPAAGTLGAQALAVVAYVVAHGRNGYFGFTSGGGSTPAPAGNRDEQRNAAWLGTPVVASQGAYAVERPLLRASAGCDDTIGGGALCEFDDQVAWISRSLLVARMAAASRF